MTVQDVSAEKIGKLKHRFYNNFCVIDVETTGLNASEGRIIEFSAIRVRKNRIVDECSILINPEIQLPRSVVKLTHITDELLEDKPCFADIAEEISAFIGSDVLLGHNVTFDKNFISEELVACGYEPLVNDYMDTRSFARKYLDLKSNRLCDVADALEIKQSAAHRSLEDCRTTLKCFYALRAIAEAQSEE